MGGSAAFAEWEESSDQKLSTRRAPSPSLVERLGQTNVLERKTTARATRSFFHMFTCTCVRVRDEGERGSAQGEGTEKGERR